MEDLVNFIVDSTKDLSPDLANVVTDTFVEVYVNYESNPIHVNLNDAVTTLHDVYCTVFQTGNGPIPTLQELSDKFQHCVRAEIPVLYGNDIDLLNDYTDIDDDVFLTADVLPEDYRIRHIRRLEHKLNSGLFCSEYKNSVKVHVDLFEYAQAGQFGTDYDIIDFIYEYVLHNLRLLFCLAQSHCGSRRSSCSS